MSISSVSSSYSNTAAIQPQSQPAEVRDREGDADGDDSSKVAAAPASQGPTVNTSGQTVGSIINTQA
ncbi:MAG: hypothetical protein GC139_02395 [Sideroxydans sp.]|nr:hypothetical protein [Sideroxydans sp.]